MRKHFIILGMTLAVLVCLPARSANAQAAAQQDTKPAYTMAEYNAFQAANAEKDPLTKIKLLDDFISRYPNSTLMVYVGQIYAQACGQLAQAKSYAQAIACADKVVALGPKAGDSNRMTAIQTRVQAFPSAFDPKAADANDQLAKERDAALLGAKLLGDFPKPKEDPRPTRSSRTRKNRD